MEFLPRYQRRPRWNHGDFWTNDDMDVFRPNDENRIHSPRKYYQKHYPNFHMKNNRGHHNRIYRGKNWRRNYYPYKPWNRGTSWNNNYDEHHQWDQCDGNYNNYNFDYGNEQELYHNEETEENEEARIIVENSTYPEEKPLDLEETKVYMEEIVTTSQDLPCEVNNFIILSESEDESDEEMSGTIENVTTKSSCFDSSQTSSRSDNSSQQALMMSYFKSIDKVAQKRSEQNEKRSNRKIESNGIENIQNIGNSVERVENTEQNKSLDVSIEGDKVPFIVKRRKSVTQSISKFSVGNDVENTEQIKSLTVSTEGDKVPFIVKRRKSGTQSISNFSVGNDVERVENTEQNKRLDVSTEGDKVPFIVKRRKSITQSISNFSVGNDIERVENTEQNKSLNVSTEGDKVAFIVKGRKSVTPSIIEIANQVDDNVTQKDLLVKPRRKRRKSCQLQCCDENDGDRQSKNNHRNSKSSKNKNAKKCDVKESKNKSLNSIDLNKQEVKSKTRKTKEEKKVSSGNDIISITPLFPEAPPPPKKKPLSNYKIPKLSKKMSAKDIKALNDSLDSLKTYRDEPKDEEVSTNETSTSEDLEVASIFENVPKPTRRSRRSKSMAAAESKDWSPKFEIDTKRPRSVAFDDYLVFTDFRVTRSKSCEMFKLCPGLDVNETGESLFASGRKSVNQKEKSDKRKTPINKPEEALINTQKPPTNSQKTPTNTRETAITIERAPVNLEKTQDIFNKSPSLSGISKVSARRSITKKPVKVPEEGPRENASIDKVQDEARKRSSQDGYSNVNDDVVYKKPYLIDLPEVPIVYRELDPNDPRRNYKQMVMLKDIRPNGASSSRSSKPIQDRRHTWNSTETTANTPKKITASSRRTSSRTSRCSEPCNPYQEISDGDVSDTPAKLKKRRKTNDDPDYIPPKQLVVSPWSDSLYDVAECMVASEDAGSIASDVNIDDIGNLFPDSVLAHDNSLTLNIRSSTGKDLIYRQPKEETDIVPLYHTKPFSIKRTNSVTATSLTQPPQELCVASSTRQKPCVPAEVVVELPFEDVVNKFFEPVSLYCMLTHNMRKINNISFFSKGTESCQHSLRELNTSGLERIVTAFRDMVKSIMNKSINIPALFDRLYAKMLKLNVGYSMSDIHMVLETLVKNFEGSHLCKQIKRYLEDCGIQNNVIEIDDSDVSGSDSSQPLSTNTIGTEQALSPTVSVIRQNKPLQRPTGGDERYIYRINNTTTGGGVNQEAARAPLTQQLTQRPQNQTHQTYGNVIQQQPLNGRQRCQVRQNPNLNPVPQQTGLPQQGFYTHQPNTASSYSNVAQNRRKPTNNLDAMKKLVQMTPTPNSVNSTLHPAQRGVFQNNLSQPGMVPSNPQPPNFPHNTTQQQQLEYQSLQNLQYQLFMARQREIEVRNVPHPQQHQSITSATPKYHQQVPPQQHQNFVPPNQYPFQNFQQFPHVQNHPQKAPPPYPVVNHRLNQSYPQYIQNHTKPPYVPPKNNTKPMIAVRSDIFVSNKGSSDVSTTGTSHNDEFDIEEFLSTTVVHTRLPENHPVSRTSSTDSGWASPTQTEDISNFLPALQEMPRLNFDLYLAARQFTG